MLLCSLGKCKTCDVFKYLSLKTSNIWCVTKKYKNLNVSISLRALKKSTINKIRHNMNVAVRNCNILTTSSFQKGRCLETASSCFARKFRARPLIFSKNCVPLRFCLLYTYLPGRGDASSPLHGLTASFALVAFLLGSAVNANLNEDD